MLESELLEELARLAERAGGWFVYSDDPEFEAEESLAFVEASVWKDEYESWLARVHSTDRPRDR